MCPSCGMMLHRFDWDRWVEHNYGPIRVVCWNCRGKGCVECNGVGTRELIAVLDPTEKV